MEYTEDDQEVIIKTGEDGVKYQWDPLNSAWFPMVCWYILPSQI